MNTQSTITPDKFADTGRALYGERWQTSLAVDLRVADRTIRRWLTGEAPIPSNIENELRELIKKRMNEMGGIIGFEVVPSNRTIVHYNTFSCYIYDEAGNVTLLNPPVGIAPTDVLLITQGAQEALRQEDERNQRGIKTRCCPNQDSTEFWDPSLNNVAQFNNRQEAELFVFETGEDLI